MEEQQPVIEQRNNKGQFVKGNTLGNRFGEGNKAAVGRRGPVTKLLEQIFESAEDSEAIKNQMLKTLTSRGMAGVLLLKEAAERIEGKVTQPVEASLEVNVTLSNALSEARKRLECLPSKSAA